MKVRHLLSTLCLRRHDTYNLEHQNLQDEEIAVKEAPDLEELEEVFKLFDRDGDGFITKEKLGNVMKSLGQFATGTELETMLEEMNADGKVGFDQFLQFAEKEEEQYWREVALKEAFKVFDKRNRGFITPLDLKAVLERLGENMTQDEIEEMVKEVDMDGDGRIDFYEFLHALGEAGTEDGNDEVGDIII